MIMEGELVKYRSFFENFLAKVNPADQLPVKLILPHTTKSEVVGAVLDWILQYLHSWDCPKSLISSLAKITLDEIKTSLTTDKCAFYFEEYKVYSSLHLMQFVIGKIQEICRRYVNDESLSSLLPEHNHYTSVFATKNRRRHMEDSHVVITDLQKLFDVKDVGRVNYYAVFDGHNGSSAALYSSAHLHQLLSESQFYPMYPEQALSEAFKATDRKFLEKDDTQITRSGTTAACILWHQSQNMLYSAWAGDSEAVLAKKGRVYRLVEPHKAHREDEINRIKEMGGVVLFWGSVWRVNGQLAVSRAIGDCEHKPYIISTPDVHSVQLDDDDDFVILACDGLWDSVSYQDAAFSVYKNIIRSPDNYCEISQTLVQLAKTNGSDDNITVIVIFLKDPHDIKLPDIDMETATAESFAPKQNGAANYCTLDDLQGGNFDHNHGVHLDDDFGPETNVDNIDDGLISQPVSTKKSSSFTFAAAEKMNNGNSFAAADQPDNCTVVNKERSPDTKQLESSLDDDKNNVSSDESDDEGWDYVKGAGNANNTSKSNNRVDGPPSEAQDLDHPLNPDAAEFVPQSPPSARKTPTNNLEDSTTNSETEDGQEAANDDDLDDDLDDNYRLKAKGPAVAAVKLQSSCLTPGVRELLEQDDFVASSPLKGHEKSMENVDVPSMNEFDKEIRRRPSNIMPNFESDSFRELDADNLAAAAPSNDVSAFDHSMNNCPFDSTTSTTNAVFGEDSGYTKRLDDLNDDDESLFNRTNEKQDVGNEKGGQYAADSTTTMGGAGVVVDFNVNDENVPPPAAATKIFENGGHLFDSEDYPSIVEKDYQSAEPKPRSSFTDELFNSTDNPTTANNAQPDSLFGDRSIRGFGDDPLDRFQDITSSLRDDTPPRKLFDNVETTSTKAPTSVADEAAAAFDPFATTSTNPFAYSSEPACVKEDASGNLVETSDTKPTTTTTTTTSENVAAPSMNQIERTLSEQIVDSNTSPSVDDNLVGQLDRLDDVTPTSEICEGGGDAPNEPCHQIDAQAPYIHDCTRLDEKPDSVHHHPVHQKHFADLTPSETTSESDKLESELRESNETKREEVVAAPRSPPPTPAETTMDAKPAAAAVIAATASVAAAATIATQAAVKDTKKTSTIKKVDEKKSPTKTAAKPTTTTTTLTKMKVASVSAAVPKTNAKPTTASTMKAATTTSSTSPKTAASRPASARPATAATSSPSAAAKTTKSSVPTAGRLSNTTGRPATAPKLPASPAKPKLTPAAKPLSSPSKSLTNGDVSSSKTSTVKRATTTTSASAAKKPIETTTKAPINLSTRTSLAPTTAKPRPTTTTTTTTKATASTVKRPATATSRVSSTNKDTKDITNKRLSTTTTTAAAATKSSQSKTSASNNVKTESKTNSGLKTVPKKPATTASN